MEELLLEEMEELQAPVMESNPTLQNGGTTESSTSDGYVDDIEAEANPYFTQMFAGGLTTDTMVQMLARFKESSVKRYCVASVPFFCSPLATQTDC
ncbi:hypothetical protein SLEP1_g23952 [Rubroshorea leprosula]|uniref:CCR4-NOT transcription complex subunit 1 TTP binding domain-containing protein n=1 Tax=Rubroshorea leprosula TaxID=152421 RepID=A0AAV5JNK0_9ROSI|nr:hypothetical protein SLEP1_g23952 [Rubroshorea leprosula]